MSDSQGFPTQRRGSIPPGTSPATSLFQRRGSLAVGIAPPPMFTSPSVSGDHGHRRHMSVSASLGLATSPTAAFDFRRSSTSTSADSVGESSSAIEDDDRPAPLQFARRLSVQPVRGFGGGPVSAGAASPITGNDDPPRSCSCSTHNAAPAVGGGAAPTGGAAASALRVLLLPPRPHFVVAVPRRRRPTVEGHHLDSTARPAAAVGRRGSIIIVAGFPSEAASLPFPLHSNTPPDQGSYDWGAHLRARAQSSVSGARPVFGTSPPREPAAPQHRQSQPPSAAPRADPPAQPAPPAPARPQRAKPDAYQERILKGDFYMD
jgi:hypothetical protein